MALYFGSNIENAYVGDAKVKKIYKGDTLVFETKPTSTYLISGSEFNQEMANIGIGGGTNVVFTNTAIPSDKISSATIVSTDDSESKAYMYLDGNTIYVSPEEDNAIIYANEDCNRMFNYCTSLTSIIGLENLDTSHVTNMGEMFRDCRALTSLDVSNFDTSNVTDMISMFNGCKVLTSLDISNWDTSNVTRINSIFNYCSSLTSITGLENLDTSNVSNMSYMFYNCNKLTSLDVSNWNTSNVSTMYYMFSDCNSLTLITGLENLDTSNVYNMSYMFNNCESLTLLDISNWNTSKVTNMNRMFSNTYSLSGSITIMNPNITSYYNMFYECSTDAGSKFTVNYKSGCQTVAKKMVSTKLSKSNVILGTQV